MQNWHISRCWCLPEPFYQTVVADVRFETGQGYRDVFVAEVKEYRNLSCRRKSKCSKHLAVPLHVIVNMQFCAPLYNVEEKGACRCGANLHSILIIHTLKCSSLKPWPWTTWISQDWGHWASFLVQTGQWTGESPVWIYCSTSPSGRLGWQ